ncbi:MAG TPA: flagellar hook-associated protein FlgK [Stellaceae bacterium]|jgi:flagellar hook-associated protein 1 FlgK|nr:flagellar hook-associated protein FlgK [Stellaceae bacterium]
MGLDIALQDAMTGLRATQAQIQVISANIANAQTPGYSEETITQTPIRMPAGGAGVNTSIIQRVSDQLLTRQIATQTSASSAATTTNSYLQQLQTLLGQVGSGSTFTDAYNNFVSAMQTEAATPEDPVAQSAAVNAGQQLAQQLNSFSSGIQTLRAGTDSDINTAVTSLNTALNQIASLNGSIAQVKAEGQSTATLEDQRDQALTQVSQLIGVSSYERPDGSMVVLSSSGQTLVDGTNISTFGYTPSGVVTAASPLSNVTLDGQNVTSSITTGQIGALLQLRNTTLPSVTAEMNQFTNNLYNLSANSNLNTTNSGTNVTNDANHFFADVNTTSGLDNASTIEVNPSLVANAGLLYNGISGADPTISSSIATGLTSSATFAAAGNFPSSMTTTLSNYAAQIVGQAATAANNATQNNTYQSQLTTQMQSRLQSETGVNLDQELGNLTIYQNAYGASARVVSTIQTMYDALMNIAN